MAGQATCRGQAKLRMAGRNGLHLLESALGMQSDVIRFILEVVTYNHNFFII
jgi:hypothetical protein